jgi:aspartyl/asparaginyl-tRNA synthetase
MKKDGPDGSGACTDLLFRGLEVTSGGMRINRCDELVESAKASLDSSPLIPYSGFTHPYTEKGD